MSSWLTTRRSAVQWWKPYGWKGYQVEEAGNGQQALAVLPILRPRVILLDMRMPVMSGWQFAETMRQQGFKSKIVVMLGGSGG